MINWNGRNAIISSYWVCLFTKFRWRLHRALRLAWITWIPFILWFSMIFKIGLNIVHGFMNATFIDDSLYQWSLTINVHSCIYEHTSCMINDHRNSYEHWSSMIIDIDYDSWRSMIVAMKCCWAYMISVVVFLQKIRGRSYWTNHEIHWLCRRNWSAIRSAETRSDHPFTKGEEE